MDWKNIQADVTKILPCDYTAGREGANITGITIHHMAGNLSIDQCYNLWSHSQTSAHYAVQSDGKIGQMVNDWDTAWACGNWYANTHTISIEHANNNSNPWTVFPAALESGAHLVAALCLYYNLGRPQWLVNVFPHRYWSSTACLPINDTELLTKDGWKLLKDIQIGEDVASAVMDDLSIVWSPVRRLVPIHRSDCWLSRDLEATSDHRILAKTQFGKEVVASWKDVCGCTKKKATNIYYLPNAGEMYGEGLPLTDAELELIIAVQADGHYSRDARRDNALENVRFHLKKERKIERLIELLDDTGYEYSINYKKDGTTDIIVEKSLHDFTEQYLKEKHFTMEFGFALDKRQKELFLDRIQDWDGCRAGYYYSSAAQDNLDVVQMIAATAGVGTQMLEGDRVNFKKQFRSVQNANAKRCYDKKVSCVTVDTGFILIRQHGRTTIVGNCPGELYGSQKDEYMSRAQSWYDVMKNGTEAAPAPSTNKPIPAPTPTNKAPQGKALVNVHYALRNLNGGWNDTVTNFNNSDANGFAGVPCGKHDYLCAWADRGTLKYQVHTQQDGWLDYVSQGNKNDLVNGCAGIGGHAIDGVRMYYITPKGEEYKQVYYRSQTVDREGWLNSVCDDGSTYGGDDFAGMYGEALDRLQVCISDANPF